MEADEPLKQLEHLAILKRSIAQDHIVALMFASGYRANKPFEKLTTWLLAGTGASASLFIGNADKVVPMLSKSGFLTVGALLSVSALFGICSKYLAVLYDMGRALANDIIEGLPKILDAYSQEQEAIQDYATSLNVTIDTDIRMQEVFDKFLEPMPWWISWKIRRDQRKTVDTIHHASFKQARILNAQLSAATLQIVTALAAMAAAFIFSYAV